MFACESIQLLYIEKIARYIAKASGNHFERLQWNPMKWIWGICLDEIINDYDQTLRLKEKIDDNRNHYSDHLHGANRWKIETVQLLRQTVTLL